MLTAMVTVMETLTITPDPIVNITPANPVVCRGGSCVTLDAGLFPGATFLWSPGGEATQTICKSPLVQTVYTVTVTDNGCVGTDTITVTVEVPPTNTGPLDVQDLDA